MSNVILKAEHISKQYRLGLVGTGTLNDDLKRWWYRLRGKEDPFLKIGAVNDRSTAAESDYVWALQDINFEVKRGEVLGIIGKNGAGKSTLLKILSRVTAPTTGEIKTKGRIASLLEVGTGFHPELTGRENIYLNGAILGMTKAEIRIKEEEIIDFSGCQRYIDTPVKRYSSGMRVRLAFAVAAHLEPDVLVIDEVLAVGDAEFQKKAIGKMQDISQGEGRTVLFVSHNMAAVQDLCTRVVVLDNGSFTFDGEVTEGVNLYLNTKKIHSGSIVFDQSDSFFKSRFYSFEIINSSNKITTEFNSGDVMKFNVNIQVNSEIRNPVFSLRLSDINNVNVITWRSNDFVEEPLPKNKRSNFSIELVSKNLFLLDSVYSISISFLDGKELLDYKDKFIHFEVSPNKPSEKYYSITKKKASNSIVYAEADWIVN
ncbi:ABC transporter ATP-binding protein [Ichthyenterobacterium sp. W332]|uniref:ABC transporter ATP-binding protein n=1 Tax=Microcosmobacter mediterraneus TaxID=3075607 RepID=A0ABU2YJV6_9FLAO|nr:ABC transporter ATP-binding protein [Ichthyenterobacterium sp. W332]MDT0557338.1 ABC transporter ATP-binding protein [Ichthyenterobacterium sp. W332]